MVCSPTIEEEWSYAECFNQVNAPKRTPEATAAATLAVDISAPNAYPTDMVLTSAVEMLPARPNHRKGR